MFKLINSARALVTVRKSKRGFGMAEILVSAALITLIGASAITAWSQYIKITARSASLTKAALITEEAGEMLVLWRDLGWGSRIDPLTLGTPYYITWNGTGYATSTTAVEFQNNYSVRFVLSSVSRDASSDIVTSGGTVDPDTLKATIVVVPTNALTAPISTTELLIHNIYAN